MDKKAAPLTKRVFFNISPVPSADWPCRPMVRWDQFARIRRLATAWRGSVFVGSVFVGQPRPDRRPAADRAAADRDRLSLLLVVDVPAVVEPPHDLAGAEQRRSVVELATHKDNDPRGRRGRRLLGELVLPAVDGGQPQRRTVT